jgi:hypothetical protein
MFGAAILNNNGWDVEDVDKTNTVVELVDNTWMSYPDCGIPFCW